MKRFILILMMSVLVAGLFSGCSLHEAKEGQIVFSLAEDQESECVWEYFVEPQGAIGKVRDEVYEKEGSLVHEWIFEGEEEGEVGITFQYSEDGKDPVRTVHYSCYVDENLYVSLMETEDSADETGTAEDELLIQCVSAAISLQFENGMNYPSKKVSPEYAQAFLCCYANLFFGEAAEESAEFGDAYITLDIETVKEILSVAFGTRFGTESLAIDGTSIALHDGCYYFATRDYAWVDAIPLDGELQYVFTMIGASESVDGTAQVTVAKTSNNRVGLALTSINAQKSE